LTLNANLISGIESLYSSDFQDRYWLAY